MSIELVMLSNHLILWCPFSFCLQSFPESGSFPVSKLFISGGQSFGASASASVLPMNIQGQFPLGLTSLITLLSKGLSRVFSRATVWKHQYLCLETYLIMTTKRSFGLQPSLKQIHKGEGLPLGEVASTLILLELNISHYLGTGEHGLIDICSNDIKEQRVTSLFILLI